MSGFRSSHFTAKRTKDTKVFERALRAPTSTKPIADFQINLVGEFRGRYLSAFAAHSFYSERTAFERDGDFVRTDVDHFSGGGGDISRPQPRVENANPLSLPNCVRARLGIAAPDQIVELVGRLGPIDFGVFVAAGRIVSCF
jgi:hypothetical protein